MLKGEVTMDYEFLLTLCIIIVSTKLLGLLSGRLKLPQVVGSLLAGLLIGPAVFGIVESNDFLDQLAELGVIVIMFSAGMETSIEDLKKSGKASFLVALLGVLLPLGLGAGFVALYNPSGAMLENIFIGTVLTATSVSITVETLKEMGKLSTRVGNTILTAALIDDILGLVCLTLVTSIGGGDVSVSLVLIKILLFFIFVGVFGFVMHKFFVWYEKRVHNKNLHRFPMAAFALCLFMAWIGEEVFGVADIIGAFSAGLIMSTTAKCHYCETKIAPICYVLLTPIFFTNIGLKVVLPEMSAQILVFTIGLILVGVGTKLIGCGLGAKITGMTTKEAIQVGVGMACRGEVALIVANKGIAAGIVSEDYFGPIVIMIVVCTMIVPILLKVAFKGDETLEVVEISHTEARIQKKAAADAYAHEVLTRDEPISMKKLRETKSDKFRNKK